MKKMISVVFVIALLIAAIFVYRFYSKYYGSNIKKDGYVLIPHRANFKQILDSVAPYVKNPETFREVAIAKKMNHHFKPGRYHFEGGKGNTSLVNMIKAGNQTPENFRIGDFYDVYQMIGKVSRKTETDSLAFATGLDSIARARGLSSAEDLKKYFFIDTYQFFWTVTPKEFFKKFDNQYTSFWNAERTAKEKRSGLSRDQIYALASIVYKESGGKPDEQKTIAGLYLNRYKKGMKLQSDPTVIYAINKADGFRSNIRRVMYKDLKTPSPYNTYANTGIPPGPICIVDKNAVDAVLNAEKNSYIYMCADPKRKGYHKFTDNDVEHAQNARAYQEWLNANNIN